MRRLFAAAVCCLGVAGWAWCMASAEGRIDADERVSSMLPPPVMAALWEPAQPVQAISFGCQAAVGLGLLWAGISGLRGRSS